MRHKTKFILLLLLTLLWMTIIGFLSTQNGAQTAQTSGFIAEYFAELVYSQPSTLQVAAVHSLLRTFAHISLFFVLGALVYATVALSLDMLFKSPRWVASLISAGLVSGYGFFDEWRKQFIVGRHFDLGEVRLNIICGLAGIIVVVCGVWLKLQHQNKRR